MGKQKKGGNKKSNKGHKKSGYAGLDEDDSDRGGGRGGKQNKKTKNKKKFKGGNNPGGQMHDDDSFRRTLLSNESFSINEMSADGNCLFRSLSDQLYGDYGNKHDLIRKDVCDFLEENEDEFSVFLLLDEHDEDVCDFDTYVGKMKEDGEWGGNVELVAAARLYRRTITVFSPTGAFSIESGHEEESGDKLLVSYHDNGHYNSVRDENMPFKPMSSTGFAAQQREGSRANGGKKAKKKRAAAAAKKTSNEEKENGGTDEETTDKTAEEATNDDSREEDSSNRAELDEATKSMEEVSGSKKKPGVILRKNDPCPCGSGLRYKKCCLPIEKSKAGAAKWKEKHAGTTGGEEEGGNGQDSREQEVELDGTFRVLKI